VPYGMMICVVITVAVVMLLRYLGSKCRPFMTVFMSLYFPAILDGQFTRRA
jgi:hypothetical protein